MTRRGDVWSKPGPECVCGYEVKEVPLPPDMQALSGKTTLLIHVESGDTRCYPDATNPRDRVATAEILED